MEHRHQDHGSSHSDPEQETRTGYLFYDGGVYDGAGADKAYDRTTRNGAIIPVNLSLPGDLKPLVVVWYERGQGGIGWPTTPMRYKAVWPASPNTITIGSGIPVSPTSRPRAMVYNQPDGSLPGMNPNEEHALLTDDKLYALRDDLNLVRNLSQPYVLLKYYNAALQEWMMDVYRVERPASFTYPVTAGSPIVAPLPGSFQVPPESDIKSRFVTGVVSEVGGEWHLRDHKGGHWAKAANWVEGDTARPKPKDPGSSCSGTTTCVRIFTGRIPVRWQRTRGTWCRFSTTAAGPTNPTPTGTFPIDVTYVTRWPAAAPALPVGDTLTTARSGLPDIYNFKSAEVVFDENVYNGKGPLAKLYAPERYLYVPLSALPAGITTETGRAGC